MGIMKALKSLALSLGCPEPDGCDTIDEVIDWIAKNANLGGGYNPVATVIENDLTVPQVDPNVEVRNSAVVLDSLKNIVGLGIEFVVKKKLIANEIITLAVYDTSKYGYSASQQWFDRAKDENGNYAQNVVVGYTEGDIYLSASSDIEVDTVMRISCGKFLN